MVDDEPLVRLVGSEALRAGCATYQAGEAAGALDMLEEQPDISARFTDNMPRAQDGLALAGTVHDRRQDVRLTLTSGREWTTRADIVGESQFIAEPCELDRIITSISAS